MGLDHDVTKVKLSKIWLGQVSVPQLQQPLDLVVNSLDSFGPSIQEVGGEGLLDFRGPEKRQHRLGKLRRIASPKMVNPQNVQSTLNVATQETLKHGLPQERDGSKPI